METFRKAFHALKKKRKRSTGRLPFLVTFTVYRGALAAVREDIGKNGGRILIACFIERRGVRRFIGSELGSDR